jgi:hypothetical protein
MTHDELLAKLDEQARTIQEAVGWRPTIGGKVLKPQIPAFIALRRQVEKHIDSYTGEACDCCEGTWDCNVCSEYYPCTFIKEVATDLGIEAWQNSTNNGTVLPYGILWSANDTR